MNNKRLLTIDDEESIQTVIKFGINMVAGWEVLSASGGRSGIATAEREIPDAILLDVMMPEMDGSDISHSQSSNCRTKTVQRSWCEWSNY
jgi:DNA-binding response OmpR family regulator